MRFGKERCLVVFIVPLVLTVLPVWAQTRIEPGFNLFTEEQDVEIGRQSAEEIEKQIPTLTVPVVDESVALIGQRLQAVIQGPDFPYRFRIANVSDVNAFALPGGFMYINRGLIEMADNEAELAGVMAHEMAHVALRHGTNQASKAYLAQAGLGILGGLIGGGQGSTGQMIEAVGGFGLNAVFLKFSRSAEEQADIVGVQTLVKAGYDPRAMVSFFEKMRELSGGEPGKFEAFFSTHPAPSDRARRIEGEIARLAPVRPVGPAGSWSSVQRDLRSLPAAPSMQDLANSNKSKGTSDSGGSNPIPRQGKVSTESIDSPSNRLQLYENRSRSFRVRYPVNWHPHSTDGDLGLAVAPNGGVVVLEGAKKAVAYGLIVSTFDPSAAANRKYSEPGPFQGRTHLETASNQFLQALQASNDYLRLIRTNDRQVLDGEEALSVRLEGVSPLTREGERVDVFMRLLPNDHLLCLVFVVPSRRSGEFEGLQSRILSSVSIGDEALRK